MGIAIKGVRLGDITLSTDADGDEKASGSYSLMSDADKVLAKQEFNSYSGMEITWSPETKKAMAAASAAIRRDILTTLGIEED